MPVRRILGGAWASVHGPAEPRALVVWALESGFGGLMPGPGPRPVDWDAVRRAMRDLPAALPALRVHGVLWSDAPRHGLASAVEGERKTAMATVLEGVERARRLGIDTVVLDPGPVPIRADGQPEDLGDPRCTWTTDLARSRVALRNQALAAALERTCRALHSLCGSFPDMRFCLTSGRHVAGLCDWRGLEAIFDDLPQLRLRYWHDAPVAARREALLGEPQAQPLELFSNRLAGMTLGDVAEGSLYLPPGTGGVDYPLLASYTLRSGRPIPVVLELDPGVDPGEIPGARAFLDKFGL